MANISRKTEQKEQNIQHFISESPWSARQLIGTLQDDIGGHRAFEQSVLVLDESADAKSGTVTAGAGRQRNGRLGKVDLCQVGVFATLATAQAHCWVDGELYIPEDWFSDERAEDRKRVGIPEEVTFATKIELAEKLILRCRDEGLLPFVAVDMDSLYGRTFGLRQTLQRETIEYYADVPANTVVYLAKPTISTHRKDGQPRKVIKVSGQRRQVCQLRHHPSAERGRLRLRPSERGHLEDNFSRLRVWTVQEGEVLSEWLLMRQSATKTTYVLSNAAPDIPLSVMAQRKTCRYFIERDNQDAKSELGWDEFQATKYRSWQHQLALTIMAAWFITRTRLEWAEKTQRDPELHAEFETDVLPALSVANVRTLLRAAMPLPQLSAEQAADLVVQHLNNRTRSRNSRLRNAQSERI